jgi:thioredoxin 1
VDDCPKTAKEFGIRSIPVCMVFKGGAKVDSVVGAVPKGKIVEAVNRHL